MSNKVYDALKRLVQVILPAFASLYFGLAAIWHLPAAEQVVGTTALIATFLGICLGLSSKKYEAPVDGSMHVNLSNDGEAPYRLELDDAPEALIDRDLISFKVVRRTE